MSIAIMMRDSSMKRGESLRMVRVSVDEPSPCIMAMGIYGVRVDQSYLESDDGPVPVPPPELTRAEPKGSPCAG